ncbi:ankyrin repeat domain-containing protein [Maribacter sp. PR1]|uniref:Ankyrin repeat domain-containing protein n=1 Tax=Maribacter cobaltidurans TaxID=1178778 RepID=A0ABU7ITT6_9FLAO|nr:MULTISPECIES: ankyrin repeat domain-containing protein [Maribacter]MDC6389002.1 ankyrin repeat domain-containing protein [Maribacter sp. PR1]MEE1976390.1 ankyrin repeat domain-containing protein [Maribacter cobaltidurans]
MVEKLKTYLQQAEIEKALSIITDNPEILELEDDTKSTGFLLIAYNGPAKVLKKAIELKKSFSFYEAIIAGKIDVVDECLRKNKNLINHHSTDGFTPVSLAAFFDQTDIAKLLLENGADPGLAAKNPSKVNALHSAVAKENYTLCELLIEKGGDVNSTQMQQVTALHSAIHRGNWEIVQLLIKNGADPSLKMENGDTPMAIAKREGFKKIEKFLADLKID